jgi:hypothetical protein
MTDSNERLTIKKVYPDTGSRPTVHVNADPEYLIVFELSRKLTDSEQHSACLASSGLTIGAHGSDRLWARLTLAQAEEKLDEFVAAVAAIEQEGQETDAFHAGVAEKRKADQMQEKAQVNETIDRLNKKLGG